MSPAVPQLATAQLVDALAGRRVLVVGDALLDAYLEGGAAGVAREAPVPTVALAGRVDLPGGAANVAANLAALGAEVRLLAAAGADEAGARLRAALRRLGVEDGGLVERPERPTPVKHRLVCGDQVVARFDEAPPRPLGPEAEAALLAALEAALAGAELVVVSDAAGGTVTPGVLARLAALSLPVVGDAKRPDRLRALRPLAVTPSWDEARPLLPAAGDPAPPADRSARLIAHGEALLAATGARVVAVTLDADGALVLERDRAPHRAFARPAAHERSVGAGDTFLAAFALALAAGVDAPVAAELGCAAAGVAVAKPRTSTCSLPELRAALGAGGALPDRRELAARVRAARARGERVVLTAGCFDLLHAGHIAHLSAAKGLGDLLVVGLNTDEGVRRLKGAPRPLVPLADRIEVLAALSGVDLIAPFAEDTPAELIRLLRPDVFAKGGDYTPETIPERAVLQEFGVEVRILPYVGRVSTRALLRQAAGAAG
jgi:D-beta-D-heptose 7-phosphate kinase/D-beta-D-heptose 1-phosphate adenosyltransferase